jgi:hypothetical protein
MAAAPQVERPFVPVYDFPKCGSCRKHQQLFAFAKAEWSIAGFAIDVDRIAAAKRSETP